MSPDLRLLPTTFVALVAALALSACTVVGDPGPVEGGADAGGGNGADAGADPACSQVEPIAITEALPPDVLLVVDKSGSMEDPLSNGQQKWSVMRTALTQVVTQYQTGINFGLMLFPHGDACTPGNVLSAVASGNSTAISSALNSTSPLGGTPTDTTLTAALAYYQGNPVNADGRYVLLATDGEPNCGNGQDSSIPTITESIAAVAALRNAGIPTYVLGFGDAINNDPTTLQAMAAAGGTGQFYAANSPAQLNAALDAIAGEIGVASCTFILQQTPADVDKLGVFIDNNAVPRDVSHGTGWDYDPVTNSITFYGSSCDILETGMADEVRVEFGCGGPEVL